MSCTRYQEDEDPDTADDYLAPFDHQPPMPPQDPAHVAYLQEWERALLAYEAERMDCAPAEEDDDAEESFR